MKEKFQLWYSYHKNAINMSKFIIISIFLLYIVWMVDIKHPEWRLIFPSYFLLPTDLSKNFLSTLSGVFLTVTTFTFSTILTVTGSYGSNFTPRIIQKFIDKPYVLSLLGIFIGGFFYTILSLFFLQSISKEQNIIAGSLGVMYGVMSMSYFVYFMQMVLHDSNGSHVIQSIYQQAALLIQEEAYHRSTQSIQFYHVKRKTDIHIYASNTGYLFGIDYDALFELVKEFKGDVVISKKIGGYLIRGMFVASLQLDESLSLPVEEEKILLKKIASCFLYSRERNTQYDYHQEIVHLVEIAMRGLSPGINDPNIAINCISKLSDLIGQLFASKHHYIVEKQNEQMRIIYTNYSVKEELYLAFHQIIHYGKDDPSVARAILQGLCMIYMISDDSANDEIKEYFEYCYTIIYDAMKYTLDKDYIESVKHQFYQLKTYAASTEIMREHITE